MWRRLILAAALLGGAVAARLLWAEYHFRAAGRDLERRSFRAAQDHAEKYLHVWPGSTAGHLLAARASRRAGDLAAAERHLSECEKHPSGDLAALALEESVLDAQRGLLTAAGEAFLQERVRQGHPQAADILQALACGYLYTYRPGEALRCLDECLRRWPGDPSALALRGRVWQGLNHSDKAEKDYRAALEADPDDAETRKKLAELLLANRQPRQAAAEYERLRLGLPEDAEVLVGLAVCRLHMDETAEARSLLDEVLAHHPTHAAALRERGAAAEAGQEPDADRWYRRALEQDPSDKEACYRLGQYLLRGGRKEEARRWLDRHAAIERDLTRLHELYAQVSRAPGDAEARCEAGLICLRNGQREEGRRWLQGALAVNPGHAGARAALAGLEAASKVSSDTR